MTVRTRHGRVATVGLGVLVVGGFLTPGYFYGEFDENTTMRLVSNAVFYAGVGIVIWAAVLWRRSRRAASVPDVP